MFLDLRRRLPSCGVHQSKRFCLPGGSDAALGGTDGVRWGDRVQVATQLRNSFPAGVLSFLRTAAWDRAVVSYCRGREDDCAIVELVPALRAFARTFCKDPGDADDLVQETLLRALKSFDQFESGTRLKSWLFTIMRNTFYTKIKVYMREAPAAAECAASRPTVEATQEWSVRGREVRDAINRLPETQREVLVLIGVLGVSYEEAAEICGCAVGTIKSRLNRARLHVLEHLGEESSLSVVETAGHSSSAYDVARR